MTRIEWWRRHYFSPDTSASQAKSYLIFSAVVAAATLTAILAGRPKLALAMTVAGGVVDLHLRFTANPRTRTLLPMNIPLTLLVAAILLMRESLH